MLDTKQWDDWAAVFCEDFHGTYTGNHPDIVFNGRDEIVSTNREILAEVVTVHQGHTPEITLHSDVEASGVWAMMDFVDMPGAAFEGYGHYHDQYRKEQGVWRISSTRLTRLKVDAL